MCVSSNSNSDEENMGRRMETAEGSVSESTVNTIKNSQIEVPNSSGAKKVYVRSAYLETEIPDIIASGWSKCRGLLQAGKQTPTSCLLDETAAIIASEQNIWCASSAPVIHFDSSPLQYRGPREVKPDQDGKFWVTVAVLGSQQTTTKTVYYTVEFVIDD